MQKIKRAWNRETHECRGQKLHARNDEIVEIELESGEKIMADQIISTCGGIETELLISDFQNEKANGAWRIQCNRINFRY